jgi:hypothetical protein
MEKWGTLISERQLQLCVIPASNCIKQGFSYRFFKKGNDIYTVP